LLQAANSSAKTRTNMLTKRLRQQFIWLAAVMAIAAFVSAEALGQPNQQKTGSHQSLPAGGGMRPSGGSGSGGPVHVSGGVGGAGIGGTGVSSGVGRPSNPNLSRPSLGNAGSGPAITSPMANASHGPRPVLDA